MYALSFHNVHAQRIPPVKEEMESLFFFFPIYWYCCFRFLIFVVCAGYECPGKCGDDKQRKKWEYNEESERVSLGEGGKKRGEKCLA